MSDLRELLAIATRAVDQAGAVILSEYAKPSAVQRKGDGSPVTAADRAADACIRTILERETAFPVVSEETPASHGAAVGSFWLVDPLDGTKEFIRRTGQFTVNVALIVDGWPVLGIVAAPALGSAFWAAAGLGAFARAEGGARPLFVTPKLDRYRVAVSRDHLCDEDRRLLDALPLDSTVPAGSSLKFCLLAEGKADLYPRFGRTMEWDTAAGQCILEQAGGGVATAGGARLGYGKPGFENPSFLAWAAPACRDAALAAVSLR